MVRSTLNRIGSNLLGITLALLLVLVMFTVLRPTANATTSSTLNFQGRLLTAGGGLVADGTYNIEFNLYTVSSGGSTQWTEDYLNTTTPVTIRNGYFSVNLGSLNAFPSTINWDQDQYLGMTVRGTGSCAFGACTPADSEMTPRFKLTAVPYAFVAGTALGVTSDATSTASTNSGNVSINTGNASGATSNSGNLTVDTGTATGTTGTISIASANASALTLGRSGLTTTNSGNLTVSQLLTGNLGATISGAAISLNDNSNFATTINTGTSTGAVTIGNGTSTAGTVLIQGGASSTFTATNATGKTAFGFAAPTTAGTVTFQLPAGGTGGNTYGVCTTLTVCSGYAAAAATGSYIQQIPTTTAANTITPATTGVVGLTVNGTNTGTAATALAVVQTGAATGLTVSTSNTGVGIAVTNTSTGTGVTITGNNTGDGASITATNTSGTQTNGLLFNRNGTGGTTTNGLAITNTLGTTTNGINLTQSGGTFTNGISFNGTFTKLINSTNFNVTNGGAVTAVGVDAGAGLLQGSLGLTVSGATASINNNSNFNTNINTGTSTGTVAIGNSAAGAITLQSATTIGLTGATTITGLSGGSSTAATIATGAATNVGLLLQGASSQTADFLQIKDSLNSKILTVDSTADIYTLGTYSSPYGGFGTYGNYLKGSSTFNGGTFWTRTNVTNPSGGNLTITAPDTTSTANRLADSASGGFVQNNSSASSPVGGTYTFSVWLKSTSGTQSADLVINGTTTGTGTATTVTTTTTWQRFWVTQDTTAFTGNVQVRIYPGTASGSGTVDAWGAQLTQTSGPVPYTGTSTTVVSAPSTTDGIAFGTGALTSTSGTGGVVYTFNGTTPTFAATGGSLTFSTGSATSTILYEGGTSVLVTGANASQANTSSATFTLQSGNATGTGTSNSGNVSVDSGSSTNGTTGTVSIGTTNSSALSLGRSGAATTVAGSTINLNSATIVGNSASLDLFNTTATAVNFLGASTATVLGATTGTLTVRNANQTFGNTAGSGVFTNNGATVFTTLAIANDSDGGALGGTPGSPLTAAQSVDVYTSFSISQTTTGQTITLPSPTASTTYGRRIQVSNIGTASFIINGSSILPGSTADFTWSNTNGGASWQFAGDGGGSGNYIQNQNTADQVADFRINGSGQAGTSFLSLAFERSSAGTLSVGTTSNTTGLTLGSTNLTGTLAVDSGANSTITIGSSASARTINIGNVAAVQGITVGSTNSTSTTLIQGGTGTGVSLQVASTGTIAIGSTTASTINVGTGAFAHTIAIGTDATTNQAISIGSATAGSTFTAESGTAATTLFNGATAHTIQLATGAAAQSVTIGSTNSTSSLSLQAGTGNINIGNDTVAKTTTINIGADNTGADVVALGSTNSASTLTLEGGTGASAIQIGNGATAHGIQIGTGAAVQTITIGSTNSTSALTLQAGTGALNIQSQGTGGINIGTNAVAQVVAIGNTTGASGLTERVGTGNYSLDGVSNSTYTLGASTTTGTFTVGGASQTGTITIGQSTAGQTINIGQATIATGNTQTISIGNNATGTGKDVIAIGNTNGASSLSLQAGSGNATLNATAGNLTLSTTTSGNISVTSAGTLSLDAATTINVGSTNTTTVNVGNTTNTTAILLQGAAGATYTIGTSNNTGGITLGNSTATNTISIGGAAGNGNTQTINIGNSATGGSTTNVTIGSTVAGTLTLQSAGGTTINSSTTISSGKTLTVTAGATSLTGSSGGSSTAVTLNTGAATNKGLVLVAASSQSADLLQLQDSTNANLLRVDASGNLEQLGFVDTPFGGLGQYGNLLTYSEQLDNAAWTATNITVTGNDGASNPAPDGNTTADKLVSSASGTHSLTQTYSSATNTTYTYSIWAKTNSATQPIQLRIDSNGTPATGTAASFTATTTWQRFSVSQTFTSGVTTVTPTLLITNNSQTVVAWGAQLVTGSNPLVYTKTVALNALQTNGTTSNGVLFTNGGATQNTTLDFADQASGLSMTASTSVDIYTAFTFNQSTAGQTITVPAPTAGTNGRGRVIYISDRGSASLTISPNGASNVLLSAGATTTLYWNGAAWTYAGTDGGSNAYIQNQNASSQTANFRITGSGQADTSFLSLAFERSAAGTLSVGTTSNTTALTVGSTNLTGNLNIDSGASSTIALGSSASARTINIGNVAAVQTITVGSTNGGSSLTLQTGTGALNIQSQGTGGINIGTNAVSQNIVIGNSTGGTIRVGQNGGTLQLDGTNFDVSTAGVVTLAGGQTKDITTAGAQAITIDNGSAAALNIGNATTNALTLGNTSASFTAESNATANLFNGATAHTIQLGTGAAVQTITIGSTNTTSALTLQGGTTGSINLGSVVSSTLASTIHISDTNNSTAAQAVTIGSAAANTGNLTIIQGGSNTTQAIQLLPNTAGGILIGATGGTGNITLGSSTATQSVLIGNGTGASTVSIANNVATATGNTVNIAGGATATGLTDTVNIGTGNTVGTGAKVIHIGDGTPAGTNTVTIGSIAATANVTTIQGGNGATAINLLAAASGNINIGTNAVTGKVINLGSVGSTANATTIHIADSTDASVVQSVTIGSNSNAAHVTAIQGGNDATAITLTPQTTGQIVIGAAGGTGNITLGSSSGTQSVLIGNGTGASTVSIANNVATATGNTVNIAGGATATGLTDTVNIGTGNSVGTGAKVIHIGDGTPAGTNTVTIGSIAATANVTTIQGGNGTNAINLLAAASGNINIGTNAVAGKVINLGSVGSTVNATTIHIADTTDATNSQAITLGSAAANTGNLTIIQGGSNTTQAIQLLPNTAGGILIGASTGTGTITVGQSTAAQNINIGSANSTTGAQVISIGNGTTGAATTVNILSGVGTAGASLLNLGNNTRVTQIDIGNIAAAAARTINLGTGSNTVGVDTLNIGTGNTTVAGGKTIHIGDGTPSGAGTNLITIGSIAALANTTTIQGGNGTGAISIQAAASGTISLGTTNDNVVTVGNTTGTSTLTFGQSTGAQNINIGSANSTTGAQVISIGNGTTGAATTVNILSGVGTAGASILNLADNTRVTQIDIGNIAAAAARTINVGSGSNTVGVDTINIGTGNTTVAGGKTIHIGDGTPSGSGSNLVTIGSTALASTLTLQAGTGNINLNASTASFSNSAVHTLNVAQSAASTTGFNLTVAAGQGGSGTGFTGGTLVLQGGAAGGTTANGGGITLTGGAGAGTGVQGLVGISASAFSASATQTLSSNTTLNTLLANAVNLYSTIPINATATGYTLTVDLPTITTVGRILYITAVNGSSDFTMSLGGTSVSISMKANSTATLIYNGTGWTAAGASSSTDLQAAYNNTLSSAGGAEIVLNNTSSSNGLTIRNNATSPLLAGGSNGGALLEIQSSIGSNLFSVNNNAIEYATNGGAETQGASSTAFPASSPTWVTAPNGGTTATITRETSTIATGQASVKIVTNGTTANQGVSNQLSVSSSGSTTATALTANLQYTVSFAAKAAANFTTLDVVYSKDGTNSSTTSCSTSNTVLQSVWSRVTCTFTAPSSGITSSNAIFIRQSDTTSRTFYIDNLSVTINGSVNFAVDGSADSGANIGGGTNNWAAINSATVSQETTLIYDTSGAVRVSTSGTTGRGVYNNLTAGIVPATSTQYRASFYARGDGTNTATLAVAYTPDNNSTSVSCSDYNTQVASASSYTLISCLFTTSSTTPVTAQQLRITQTAGSATIFYVDALTVTLNQNTANNVQIGGANNGGPITLFTLDRSAGAPIAANNDAYLGSMYYDTSTSSIQCYGSSGWGACGAAPDNIVNLTPEFPGAVLNGSGVGTMTADFCANQSGVLQVNTSLCDGTGSPAVVGGNFYKWTSPQSSLQTYSIYISYQLPTTFKSFSSDNTVQLTGRVDSTTNAAVTYQMYKSESGVLTQCGTGETAVTSSNNTWQTVGINGNEATGCSFTSSSAGDTIIFKINVKASNNSNAYVAGLSFTTKGK